MAMMECPHCGNDKSCVVDSRKCADGIRRRRECENCGERWTTYEFPSEMVRRMKELGIKIGIREGRKRAKHEQQHSVSVHN